MCHAYSLMDNHYHLLIATLDANLAKGMRHCVSFHPKGATRFRVNGATYMC